MADIYNLISGNEVIRSFSDFALKDIAQVRKIWT